MEVKKYTRYKDQVSFEERKRECDKILALHSDKIPIIVEKHPKSKLNQIEKTKYLVNNKFRVFQLTSILKQKITTHKADALYIFANEHTLLASNQELIEAYAKYKENDGFLYITFFEQQTFGQQNLKNQD